MSIHRLIKACVVLAMLWTLPALAQVGTSFTYQGQLSQNGSAANASADFRFRLYDSSTSGTQIGSQISVPGLSLTNGLFTANLDFGVNPYAPNTPRYLEIDVRSPAAQGNYSTLSPRQALTPTPFALNTRGVVVDSSGNVAIGTSTTAGRLVVDNNADANGNLVVDSGLTAPQFSTLRLSDRGTAFWSVNKTPTDDFSIRESGPQIDRLYIEQGGNVGIGTTNPASRLHLFSGDAQTTLNIDSGSTASQVSQLRFSDQGTAVWTINKFASNNFAIRESAGPNDRLTILPGGNVGIGTNSPSELLDVHNGTLKVGNNSANGQVRLDVTSNNIGRVLCVNNVSGGSYVAWLGESQAAPGHGGQVVIGDQNGVGLGALQMNSAGNCVLIAQVKNFMVPNPLDPDTDIFYACVEGPEAAMYVRGAARLVNGRCTVSLPSHFSSMLSSTDSMTIQLTPTNIDCRGLAVIRKGPTSFDVGELLQGASNCSFDWEAKAVRSGFENYKVIRPKGSLTRPEDPQDSR